MKFFAVASAALAALSSFTGVVAQSPATVVKDFKMITDLSSQAQTMVSQITVVNAIFQGPVRHTRAFLRRRSGSDRFEQKVAQTLQQIIVTVTGAVPDCLVRALWVVYVPRADASRAGPERRGAGSVWRRRRAGGRQCADHLRRRPPAAAVYGELSRLCCQASGALMSTASLQLIGKHGVLSLFPFTQPIAAALRQLEGIVDVGRCVRFSRARPVLMACAASQSHSR
jgi:hypothetical protein